MIVAFECVASESRPAVRPRARCGGRGVWWRFAPRLTALGLDGSRGCVCGLAIAWIPLAIAPAAAEEVAGLSPPAVSVPQDQLRVAGVDGTAHGFDELLGDGRAVCFAFLHPACPMAQDYAPVLDELAARFDGDGIRVVGVVCEADDPAEVEAYRTKFGITFPIHFDTGLRWPRRLMRPSRPRRSSWTAIGRFAIQAGSTTATRSAV